MPTFDMARTDPAVLREALEAAVRRAAEEANIETDTLRDLRAVVEARLGWPLSRDQRRTMKRAVLAQLTAAGASDASRTGTPPPP